MMRSLLLVVEGIHDAQFLLRLSDRLRHDIPDSPDLREWVAAGKIVLVPVGGGDPASWPDRFGSLGHREFHLYDREQSPETQVRQLAIEHINNRPGCQGFLTSKRSIENYLHTQAITDAGGGHVTFGDHNPVCLLLARHWYHPSPASPPWDNLPRRTQRRLAAQAKRWLNTAAVDCMSAALLAERDPAGEVLGWFRAIGELAEVTSLVGS
jgi:hypothetical protein